MDEPIAERAVGLPAGARRSAAEEAWAALRGVFDPELAIDIVSLGLVYGIEETAAGVKITMTLTTPGCPVAESLPDEAVQAVRKRLGADAEVELDIVWEPEWTPEMIDPEALKSLGR